MLIRQRSQSLRPPTPETPGSLMTRNPLTGRRASLSKSTGGAVNYGRAVIRCAPGYRSSMVVITLPSVARSFRSHPTVTNGLDGNTWSVKFNPNG